MLEPIPLPAFNPGPLTGEGNNTYLLIGSNGRAALIDAGVGDERHVGAIERALGERLARLEDVLVTHGHGDHASGAPALARAFPDARFRKQPWPGEDTRYQVPWLPLAEGDRVRAGDEWLTAVSTPGHSPDHLAFWHEPSRTAFTGDLVVAGTTVIIVASRGGNLVQYLASLERIRTLDPARLLPAHGPEISDPSAILTRYVEHRMRREQQVLEALSEHPSSVQQIVESIYHGLPPPLAAAAAENVRAHLEKLTEEGRVARELDRWRLK